MGIDFVRNQGYQLLDIVGSSYSVDLNSPTISFEERLSRKMTGVDKDTVQLIVSGEDYNKEEIFIAMKQMMNKRYTTSMQKQDNLVAADGVKNSEAALWFFLYGIGSTVARATEDIDVAVGRLIALANAAIIGKAFYPKQTVVDLMEGALKSLPGDVAPLVRKLGYIIIEKGLAHHAAIAGKGTDSKSIDMSRDDYFISAEYFQFWTELAMFVQSSLPKTDVLATPMTILITPKVTITISNINLPQGGPLLLPQFEALLGFLDAKGQQLLSVNSAGEIAKDYQSFDTGFNKEQIRAHAFSKRIFLGKRHMNAPIRAQEFRFLAETMRYIQRGVSELQAKFSKAADMQGLKVLPDSYSEYDKYDLISELYLREDGGGEGGGGQHVQSFLEEEIGYS